MSDGPARHLCTKERRARLPATSGRSSRRRLRQLAAAAAVLGLTLWLTLGPGTRLAGAVHPAGSRQARSRVACVRRKGYGAEAGSDCSGAVVEICCIVSLEIVSGNAVCRALDCGCAGGGSESGPCVAFTGCKAQCRVQRIYSKPAKPCRPAAEVVPAPAAGTPRAPCDARLAERKSRC